MVQWARGGYKLILRLHVYLSPGKKCMGVIYREFICSYRFQELNLRSMPYCMAWPDWILCYTLECCCGIVCRCVAINLEEEAEDYELNFRELAR